MCQLLGINCAAPTDTTFSFTGFAARGGITDHHADGWGIAFFEDRACRLFIDHQPASTSAVAEFVKRYPIKSKNIIAHIRKATKGVVRLENCHPLLRDDARLISVFPRRAAAAGRAFWSRCRIDPSNDGLWRFQFPVVQWTGAVCLWLNASALHCAPLAILNRAFDRRGYDD